MSNVKYLLRLDDACPTMDVQKWDRIEKILDAFGIKPMVGIIPSNADPKQQIDIPDPAFWKKVKHWESKGWSIALHGYDHCYISKDRGINPLWNRSEFAGVSLAVQKEKIRKGIEVFNSHGIIPKYFFAPSHTFDENTLIALREESNIRIISDTIALKPYRINDFIFIPQLGGSCKEMPISGIWTFCLHPSYMTESSFNQTRDFLIKNHSHFTTFNDLLFNHTGNIDFYSKILRFLYFSYRTIFHKNK